MRGVECAYRVICDVESGMFASEALRRYDVAPPERKLAATLVYSYYRRLGLWRNMLVKFCRRNPKDMDSRTTTMLLLGIAGITELRYFAPPVLINALMQLFKNEGAEPKNLGLVNAVLHTVLERGPAYVADLGRSTVPREQATFHGVSGWAAAEWAREWSPQDARRLLRLSTMKTYASLRLSPGVDADDWIARCGGAVKAWRSSLVGISLRTASNPYPPDLPGYADGEVTPQGESSMLAVESLLPYLPPGGHLLDMCAGRGVKSAHIAQRTTGLTIEGWDISGPRLASAAGEMKRLRIGDKVRFNRGDAIAQTPERAPDVVLLDAPCSGSGTWGRHPEGKWKVTPEGVAYMAGVQAKLLDRAFELVTPGGLVAYCTCSIFRSENEKVVAESLGKRRDVMELPVTIRHPLLRKGKPYGTLIWPGLPWVDGFYIAIFKKKS